ncbi:MAG: hypothetical protein Q8L87_09305 [Anaerolineales bacterium]|nr:hypothetical protein [Anaerolineales bacterium]
MAYRLAMEIFEAGKSFPKKEKYSLRYEEVGKMLGAMMSMPEKFMPRK